MTYETYRYIFLIAAILCGIMFAVSIILFFTLRVPSIIGDLSGSTARKAIQDIREKNEMSGDKTYKTSAVNRGRGKLTDKISPSGRISLSSQTPMGTGVVTTKIATQQLMPTENETTVLQQDQMMTDGKKPAGETTVLSQEELSEAPFEIEFDITYVHTNEIVRN